MFTSQKISDFLRDPMFKKHEIFLDLHDLLMKPIKNLNSQGFLSKMIYEFKI